MNKCFSYISGCLIAIVCLTGCYYDKAELVYATAPACDTVNMTYTKDIVPIMQARCYSCHAGSASGSFGINLDSYNDLKSQATSGELLHRITTSDPSELMPKGGPKLPACEISKINAWIQAGTPN